MAGQEMRRITAALAGNPNVGKSTLFNALTGMRQHTGNWPGKTVELVQGRVRGEDMELIDLPGTYALTGASEDERVAAEYIAEGTADCIVAVCDGSSLERSLILTLQVLGLAKKAVVCVNLMDEAARKGITVHKEKLSALLGVPVVLTSAGTGEGVKELIGQIGQTAMGPEQPKLVAWPDCAPRERKRPRRVSGKRRRRCSLAGGLVCRLCACCCF